MCKKFARPKIQGNAIILSQIPVDVNQNRDIISRITTYKEISVRYFMLTFLLVLIFAGAVPVSAQGEPASVDLGPVCSPSVPAGFFRCYAHLASTLSPSAPAGLSPAKIKAAYSFPTDLTAGSGQTIAIVDAFNDPKAESDLAVFSAQFGLPACTTANGCFSKMDQNGGTNYPANNSSWGVEISLDIQWAHAIAPAAHILLVEAKTNSSANLYTAEDYARTHAGYVSNSWGGPESSGELSSDFHFSNPGVSIFASAGDSGLPAQYPSASPNLISVGGTRLHFKSGLFTKETGWSKGGGGCSKFEVANPAQLNFSQYPQSKCTKNKRSTPDVSLDADPASGVSVFDSFGHSGWLVVGGTSASSPMWAARAADTGGVVDAAFVYGSSIAFRDIISGNNGAPCLIGFDRCSGRGSWTGLTP
jgi:subtilase family serine protease